MLCNRSTPKYIRTFAPGSQFKMSAPEKTTDPFFPSIRDAAEKTDQLPEDDSDAQGESISKGDEEERPLQEVESLCMSCGEQVRKILFRRPILVVKTFLQIEGTHPDVADLYSLL